MSSSTATRTSKRSAVAASLTTSTTATATAAAVPSSMNPATVKRSRTNDSHTTIRYNDWHSENDDRQQPQRIATVNSEQSQQVNWLQDETDERVNVNSKANKTNQRSNDAQHTSSSSPSSTSNISTTTRDSTLLPDTDTATRTRRSSTRSTAAASAASLTATTTPATAAHTLNNTTTTSTNTQQHQKSSDSLQPSKSALIRLKADLKAIEETAVDGVDAAPIDLSNLLVWRGSIFGPENSEWEGSICTMLMTFSPNYPLQAPSVKFTCRMFHPNVFPTGELCLDLLKDAWSPAFTVSSILQAIRSLLTDPNVASPANNEAARLYQTDKKAYRKKVRQVIQLTND